jgi:hypothetical protein
VCTHTVEEAQGRPTERAEAVVDDSNDARECGRGRGRAADKPELATVIDLEVPALRGDLAGGCVHLNGVGWLNAQRRTSGYPRPLRLNTPGKLDGTVFKNDSMTWFCQAGRGK